MSDGPVQAGENAALRRVATLVAQGASPADVCAAVTAEAGRLLGADLAGMARFDADGMQTLVAVWSAGGAQLEVGTRLPVTGVAGIAQAVRESGAPERVDDWSRVGGAVAESVRALGVRASVGSPIVVAGRLWGLMIVDSHAGPLPDGTELRLAHFTELVATAVATSEAHRELQRLADEQSALRRVATLVAHGASPDEVFSAVAAELGRLLSAPIVHLNRLGADGDSVTVAAWSERGDHLPAGTRLALDGESVTAAVLRTGRPARVDDYADHRGTIAGTLSGMGIRSSVGSPIVVEGDLWGVMVVAAAEPGSQPEDTEARLAGFTELVGTAIANAHARAEVTRLAAEQAALRRVATLVAQEPSAAELFFAVAEEVGAVLAADVTRVLRYEADGDVTIVAGWGETAMQIAPGTRMSLDGDNVSSQVLRRGEPATIADYAVADGPIAARLRDLGVRCSMGAPIVVDGRLWGVVIAAWSRAEPPEGATTERIAEFTELVATAIANAESRAKLSASRARVVAAADAERRRIERNLHDGAQQRLVSVALVLRTLEAGATTEQREQIGATVAALEGVLDDLQEISRGLHPAILSHGGLESALRVVARRSTVPVTLDVDVPGRLAEAIEVTAYYVATEALANTAKHARARTVAITARVTEAVLSLEVRDDGVGGANAADGSGIVGLGDRVEAIGGWIEVVSPPGAGTTLRVELPLL